MTFEEAKEEYESRIGYQSGKYGGVPCKRAKDWTPGYGKLRFRPNGGLATDKSLEVA